jgi:hypothetical protein
MFKIFTMVDHRHDDHFNPPIAGDLSPQKICVNLKQIDALQQIGHWINHAVPNENFIARRHHIADNRFIVAQDRFTIIMKTGNQFNVIGNFDEIADILSNFPDDRETV